MTTGNWYEGVYDSTLYPPGSDCKGTVGTSVVYDEGVSINPDALFGGGALQLPPLLLPPLLLRFVA